MIISTAVEGCSYAEVRTNEQARSDASNACPLHLLCKCGVPASRSRLACMMNFRLRTMIILAKGSSYSRLTADLHQGFTSLDSDILNVNFCTITNSIQLKLQVQFDICCRTGLIQRSLTEAKRNWMFASFQRTNSRQSAVSLLQFTYDLVFSTTRDNKSSDSDSLPASHSTARTF